MRKVLLLGFVFLLAMPVIAAGEKRFWPGIKGGGNINWADWDPTVPVGELKSGLSYNVGGLLDVDISENYGLEIDILYNSIKTKWDYSEFDPFFGVWVDYEATWTLTTLSIPLLAKYKLPLRTTTLFVGIGPELGFVLSHKGKLKMTALDVTGEITTDFKDVTESVIFGAVLCAGGEINLRGFRLVPELRYNLGVTDIDKTGASVKNSQLLLLLGLEF